MRKWLSLLTLLVPIGLLFFIDYSKTFSKDEYDMLKNQVELISWIFGGIISFVSFFALFIGMMYENKLLEASKELREIYHPYTLSTEELRQNLIRYYNHTSSNRLLNFIYCIFLIVTAFTILVWGTAVGFYTKYRISLHIDFSLPAVLNFNIYAFYIILCILLIGLTLLLNQLKNNKDPINKGYLPTARSICDINFLLNKNVDMDELILKISPYIEFYQNPPVDRPTYEINFKLPIKMSNFRFVIKLYDQERNLVIKCYGLLDNINSLGENYSLNLTTNCQEDIYKILQNESTGELKMFDNNNTVISRISMRLVNESASNFRLVPTKSIPHREVKELDHALIANLKNEKIHIVYEK